MMRKFLPLMAFLMPGISFLSVAQSSDIPETPKHQYGFIENKGQIINQENQPVKEVLYLLNTPGLNVQLRKGGFSYDTYITDATAEHLKPATVKNPTITPAHYEFHRVDITLEGANTNCNIVAEEAGRDYINFYTTGIEQGALNVQHYNRITYKNIYPGIDMEFVANQAGNKPVEYNFIVHPGADASQIKMRYTGANNVKLENSVIKIELKQGSLSEVIPASFIASTRQPVSVAYLQKGANTFGYNVPAYDRTKTLIIDPTPNLAYASYYGGSQIDVGRMVSVSGTSMYITGSTLSSNNIATTGTHQSSINLMADAFVAKFTTSGTRLWGTYLGNSGQDLSIGLASAISGSVFISGQTSSSSGFATSGAMSTTLKGTADAFIAKFNTAGARQWASYIGGFDLEAIHSIALNSSGNVGFCGTTSSQGMSLSPSDKDNLTGTTDAFIGVFDGASATGVFWACYAGSDGNDEGYSIVMDANGNAYLAGIVHAVAGFEYFTTTGCHQQTYGGSSTDFFLIKYNSSGTRLWGTFYGGSSDEIPNQGQKLALDGSGNIYMVGSTLSSNNIASSGSINGNADGFVAKFNPSGVRQWAKYIGTSAADSLEGVAADASGNVYVTGYTMSSSGIATSNAYQTSNNGIHNSMFAIKLNSTGTTQWGTYVGGNIDDAGYGIAVDANGSAYICGSTVSTSGITTTGSHQSSYGGNTDAFFAKLTECSATISGTATQTSACTGQNNGTLTVNPSGGAAPYEYKLGTGSFQTSNVFSGLASGAYSITIQDAAGCIGTFNTSVNQVPGVTTPIMTGSTAAEEFTIKQYSTNQQSGATYQWTVTQGTITAGQGTDAITVTWGPKTASGAVKVVVSQGAPCMDSTTITVNLTPSGISDITMETDIQVYPNPATDKLTIRMQADPKGEEIKLFDNYGKLVMRAPANKEQTIDISALPAGVYHINIGAWSRNISKL